MQTVRNIFQERVNDVEVYFTFIDSYITSCTNDDLNKILKSNLLLMLYNLIESSMGNAVQEIHNEIYNRKVSFDTLNTDLKKRLIKYLKNNLNPDQFVKGVNNIALDIIKQCFDKQKLFNGNIDSKKIQELSKNYGFSSDTDYKQTHYGSCLVYIKGRRNDLAHGTYSFTEVGKEYSLGDLELMKKETINYLSEIIKNIERYLKNKEYMQTVVTA